MFRRRLPILVVSLVLLGLGGLVVYSAEESKKMTDAEREQFIKDFHRTGLNTTLGDAMMLRILVEGARCKRGVEVGSATGFGAINMGVASSAPAATCGLSTSTRRWSRPAARTSPGWALKRP